ncbi:hypothetical protein [Desulfovibrio litoralis]|uniref:Uncharacterized protein n=1 Tax=Desulfovibrio litoralis DSM 11393 TaxID=1121455 RepID=A0A1M7SXQ4_9BACT|nr:hypothetical protein [Desulfovibrio litoralis]SHN63176.1 hypothetical protein SAMN02745728_01350 [Desulfovibrio litoralis DSM 11393]
MQNTQSAIEQLLDVERYTTFSRRISDPVYNSPPYSSAIDDAIYFAEKNIEKVKYQFDRGFPARLRAGEDPLFGNNTFGTRLSPLRSPERIVGSLMTVSI